MDDAGIPPKCPPRTGGRRKVADPKDRPFTLRFTGGQFAELRASADRAGLSVGELLRTLALGSPRPRAMRRPPVEVREIARLYGAIGKLGSNVNQLAHVANASRALPVVSELKTTNFYLMEMHDALMQALGREL